MPERPSRPPDNQEREGAGGRASARRYQRPALFALLAMLLTLPAMWPLLSHSGYWDSHDGAFHLYRLLSLREAWAQGLWYPRLFADFAFGYGYAVLNFYGPLSYYVALALSGLAEPILAMKLTFTLSYPLSALAMWWAARDLWRDQQPNEIAGLLAAATYTYLPYHLADVQLRGALAESWAFVWWPLVVWALWRGRCWPLALSMAALIVTHNLSAILLLVLLIPLAALALWQATQRQEWGRAVAAATLYALALSAFYWLPVLLESSYVALSTDVGGTGVLGQLAPWQEWIAPSASYRYMPEQGVVGSHPLAWAHLALMLGAALALTALWRRRHRTLALLFWGLLIAQLFLLTTASSPLWETFLFPFGLIQYPWRWLGPASLVTALLVGTLALPRWGGNCPLALVPVGGLLVWLALSSLQHLPLEARAIDLARHPVQMWEEDAANDQVGATWTKEFLPLTVEEQRWLLTRAPESPPPPESPTPIQLLSAGSDGTTLWARVVAGEEALFTFPRFAYPSMQVTVDGVAQEIEPRSNMGLASVRVPEGEHEVVLQAMPLSDAPWLTWLLGILPVLTLLWAARRYRWLALAGLALVAASGLRLQILADPLPTSVNLPTGEVVTIGEQAQFLGLQSLPESARPGTTVPLMLLWFNLAQTTDSYISYIHLREPGVGGPPLAQDDRIPNSGMVPTTRWLPGALVEDLHLLTLPETLPQGTYELWAGLYQVVDGSSAPIPNDDGAAHRIGTLEVE